MGSWSKAVIAVLALAISLLAASAPIAQGAGPAGVVPDTPTGTPSPRASQNLFGASLDYQGGQVMHTNRTHVVFWNPSNSLTWDPGYRELITGFLTNVAADSHRATNVYGLTGQYGDATGRAVYDSTFAAPALQDTDPVPANGCTLPAAAPPWLICLSDIQLRTELTGFISAHSLPTGQADIYFLVTPSGFGTCTGAGPMNCSLGGSVAAGYCGYHGAFGPGASPTLYANIPYTAVPSHCQSSNPRPNGTADPTLSTLSHEHNETITDPLVNAWINTDKNENGDLCAGNFGPALGGTSPANYYNEVIGTGHYFIQEEWSNEDAGGSTDPNVGCKPADEADPMTITAPTGPPGTAIGFTGTAKDPDGMIVSYRWSFGGGSAPAGGAKATHTYATTGAYRVTLTVNDITGQQDSLTKTVIVDRAPAARFSLRPGAPAAGQPVSFNASGSSDADGGIGSYHWRFGDGSNASGATSAHAYRQGGRYRAQLTVTDNLGVSASSSRSIRIAPAAKVSASVRSGTLLVKINQAGQVTVGSKRKQLSGAGTAKFTIGLSPSNRRRLQASHSLKLKIKIKFVPRTGRPMTKTVTVTLRG